METNLNEKESLELITRMISTAKEQIQKSFAYNFLLWGYSAIFIVFVVLFINQILNYAPYGYYAFFLFILPWVLYILKQYKANLAKPVKTYIGETIKYLWFALTISILLLTTSGLVVGNYFIPLISLFIAVGVFITGIAYKFKPLVIGSIAFWLCAAITFHVNSNIQLIIYMVAIAIGYIVPGHIIKAKDHV